MWPHSWQLGIKNTKAAMGHVRWRVDAHHIEGLSQRPPPLLVRLHTHNAPLHDVHCSMVTRSSSMQMMLFPEITGDRSSADMKE